MSIPMINNEIELTHYNDELAAAKAEQDLLVVNNSHQEQLDNDIRTLEKRIAIFTANANRLKKQPIEESIEQYAVTPMVRLGWNVLLGIGIIIQETVLLTAEIVKAFLFPLHFAIEGMKSLWDLRRFIRNKDMAHRKVQLAATAFNIIGLAVAAVLVGLAVANPFALPVVFIGIVGVVMARDIYLLKQNKIAINALKVEQASVIADISTLRTSLERELVDSADKPLHQARLVTLEARQARLDSQLTHLREQRTELRRNVFFHALSMIAVGLLITAAVASLFFPPVAIAIAGAGFLLFAAVSISHVLSSPPVRAKIAKAMDWVKDTLGIKKSAYTEVPREDLQAEAVISPLQQEKGAIAPPAPAPAVTNVTPRTLEPSMPGVRFFDHETRTQKIAANSVAYPLNRSQSTPNFFKPAVAEVVQPDVVFPAANESTATRVNRVG